MTEELKLLEKLPHLSFKEYLVSGYVYYIRWLQMTLGLASHEELCFMVARNLNNFSNCQFLMGFDLEFRHALYLMEKKENMTSSHLLTYLKQKYPNMSMSYYQSLLTDYYQDPKKYTSSGRTLTLEEFKSRLEKHVPVEILDQHSRKVWRRMPSSDEDQPFPLRRVDLVEGADLAPPTSHNIGLYLLQLWTRSPLDTKAYPHTVYWVL